MLSRKRQFIHPALLLFGLLLPLFGQIEIPTTKTGGKIVRHEGYSLEYSENHEQARWVAYELTALEVAGSIERSNDFRIDPLIETGSATIRDYEGSGYDRGHLAPAGDMKWSSMAMSESFFMSNMSPQVPAFNRGIWKTLESNVRNWAIESGSVFIVTGGILEEGLSSIGRSQVTVPLYYYKVILDYQEPEFKAIGFILPNMEVLNPLSHYILSIDDVEAKTGIDFFHLLSDEMEEMIEAKFEIEKWFNKNGSGEEE